MSCYECKYGPTPCERYSVEGHTMLCQVSKDYTINYSWNEKMYHDYLRNRLIWEKTMEETLNELKQTFGDNDTTEVQPK